MWGERGQTRKPWTYRTFCTPSSISKWRIFHALSPVISLTFHISLKTISTLLLLCATYLTCNMNYILWLPWKTTWPFSKHKWQTSLNDAMLMTMITISFRRRMTKEALIQSSPLLAEAGLTRPRRTTIRRLRRPWRTSRRRLQRSRRTTRRRLQRSRWTSRRRLQHPRRTSKRWLQHPHRTTIRWLQRISHVFPL